LQIQENISLKKFNTFGIDARARYFASFQSIEQLNELLRNPLMQQHSNLVLGGGSNVLFTKDINAVVLKNEIGGIEKTGEDENYYYIRAGAGENWHRFVLHCLGHQYAGVENLALIPGNVGASPMQNIGAYGVEIKDVFHSLEAVQLSDGHKVIFNKDECAFGYRESVFKNTLRNRFIITAVTYRLLKQPSFNISYGAIGQELEKMKVSELSIQAVAEAVMHIRKSKLPDPAVIGNAGSFFKNPEITAAAFESLKTAFPAAVGYPLENGHVKVAAGWLIEQCGWKGYRKGDAGCHEKQALVLVNFGHASGAEIYVLSEEIIKSVHEKFGITLEREVNII